MLLTIDGTFLVQMLNFIVFGVLLNIVFIVAFAAFMRLRVVTRSRVAH